METITIYCDGACSGNQFKENKGGWGAVLQYKGKEKQVFGGEQNTTNQRMELTACIKALEQIKTDTIKIKIYSDSAYLINCMKQKWYKRWQKNGWTTSSKKKVENKDLWIKLLELVTRYDIDFHKVAGHSGVELNEVADRLANKGMKA